MGDFICFRVRLRGPNAGERVERLIAETWAAGASGHEEYEEQVDVQREQDLPGRDDAALVLVIYAPSGKCEPVWQATQDVVEARDEVAPPETVEAHDWTQAWSEGLQAMEISPRLVVRPSTVSCDLRPDQLELVIDPGLAFGTGTHASTRLALDWIGELDSQDSIGPATRVLDVGTGTGLLALAALRLGAGFAVGFDIDPLAPPEALRWARHNRLAHQFRAFTGPLEALAGPPFELVLANLLRTEMLPIAAAVTQRVAAGGLLILSGLLVAERAEVESALAELGFGTRGSREHRDETGDHWLSLLVARR